VFLSQARKVKATGNSGFGETGLVRLADGAINKNG